MDQISLERGNKNLLMLEPELEPKHLDTWSWSLKFEFGLHIQGAMAPIFSISSHFAL